MVPDTELGEVQVRPEGDEAETVNVTVPPKPFRVVTVIVEAAALVARTGYGLTASADMLKSMTWKTMFPVERVTGELPIVPVPVTVTV